jgi:ankyrin repeat protein
MTFRFLPLRFIAIAGVLCVAQLTGGATQDQQWVDKITSLIFLGDTSSARPLLANVQNVDTPSSGGHTMLLALSMVPGLSDDSLAQQILSRTRNIDVKDPYGLTALYYAAAQDKLRLVEQLLIHGADVNAVSVAGSPLVGAADNHRTNSALRLLRAPGVQVESADRYGRTALLFAAIHSDAVLTRELLQHRANPNIYETVTGKTPLLWAASATDDAPNVSQTLALLLDANANPQFRNPFTCESVMHTAVRAQNITVVRLLLTRHISAEVTDASGMTPVGLAKRLGNHGIEQALLDALQAVGGNLGETGVPTRDCRSSDLPTLARKETVKTSENVNLVPTLRDAIAIWSRKNKIALHPDLPGRLNEQIEFFRQIVCSPRNGATLSQDCKELLADTPRLRSLVEQDLNQTYLEHKNPIPWFAARLSSAMGIDFTRAGYGDAYRGRNTTSCMGLPSQYVLSHAYLVNGTELADIPVGYSLCLPDGLYTIVLPEKSLRLTVRFASDQNPRTSITSTVSLGSQTDMYASHIKIPTDLLCLDAVGPDNPITAPLPRRDDISIPKPKLFSTVSSVLIDVKDSSGLCTAECLSGLRLNMLTALMVWRSGCSRCSLSNMMLVRFGKVTYISTQTLSVLEGYIASNRALPPAGIRETSPIEFAGYDLSDQSLPKLASICRSGPQSPYNQLCGESDPMDSFRLDVNISDQKDSCQSEQAIACASPDGAVELRATNHVFEIRNGGSSALHFGRSGQTVNLLDVLIHELGHFFGIPHVDNPRNGTRARTDAMSPYYNSNSCVTRADLNMLNQAVDPRWPFRLEGCAGLHF